MNQIAQFSPSNWAIHQVEHFVATEDKDTIILKGGKNATRVVVSTLLTGVALVETVVLALLTAVCCPLYLHSKTEHVFNFLAHQTTIAGQSSIQAFKGIFGPPSTKEENTLPFEQPKEKSLSSKVSSQVKDVCTLIDSNSTLAKSLIAIGVGALIGMNHHLINPRYFPKMVSAFTAVGLASAALFSRFEAIKIMGLTVLTGASYGIINDLFANRECIEYFTVGHFFDGLNLDYRLVNTLNPNVNAIAWGIFATWKVATLGGIILATIARAPFPKLPSKIKANQITPYVGMGASLIFLLAHTFSQIAKLKMLNHPILRYRNVPLNLQASWHACNMRNLVGYAGIGVGVIVLSIGIIAARIVQSKKTHSEQKHIEVPCCHC